MGDLPEVYKGSNLPDEEEVIEGEIVEDVNPSKEALLEKLRARRERSMIEGQIDNAALYAGDPMYYYCKFCGIQTDVMPETWFLDPPSQTCGDCSVMIELQWHDGETPGFPLRVPPGAPGRIPNLSD